MYRVFAKAVHHAHTVCCVTYMYVVINIPFVFCSHVVAHNYRVCICMQKEALHHKILFEHSLPIFYGLDDKKVSDICAHVDLEHMDASLSVLHNCSD